MKLTNKMKYNLKNKIQKNKVYKNVKVLKIMNITIFLPKEN